MIGKDVNECIIRKNSPFIFGTQYCTLAVSANKDSKSYVIKLIFGHSPLSERRKNMNIVKDIETEAKIIYRNEKTIIVKSNVKYEESYNKALGKVYSAVTELRLNNIDLTDVKQIEFNHSNTDFVWKADKIIPKALNAIETFFNETSCERYIRRINDTASRSNFVNDKKRPPQIDEDYWKRLPIDVRKVLADNLFICNKASIIKGMYTRKTLAKKQFLTGKTILVWP